MDLNYDTHLKPATEIKKAKGENYAIDYLFELLYRCDWNYFDHWSILDKMAGYYKKVSDHNRKKIIEEFHKLLDGSKKIDYYAKVACYKRLAGLYEQEKKDEIAIQMLSGALVNNHPQSSSYLYETSDIFLKKSNILGRKNLIEKVNAADYLYSFLTSLLYTMAWYKVFPNDNRPDFWKSNINPLFPFEKKSAMQAFNTLSGNYSAEQFASLFQTLLFETFPIKFAQSAQQTEAVKVINHMVNDYLKSLDLSNN